MASERHNTGSQGTVNGACGPRRHTRRFNRAIERCVKLAEAFIVKPVARLVDVEQRKDQARLVGDTTDAACSLDILGCGLRLPLNDHQPEPTDIQTDRNHVSR